MRCRLIADPWCPQCAFTYVYLADRSTCPEPDDHCNWKAPRYHEDVLPVVRAVSEAARTGAAAAKLNGAIDLRRRPRLA